MNHSSSSAHTSRVGVILVALLAVYLGGFALLRANCDASSSSWVVLPRCLHHQPHQLSGGLSENVPNRLRWLVVSAYQPLLQLDMKLTKRTYVRAPFWSADIIEPWF